MHSCFILENLISYRYLESYSDISESQLNENGD